MKKYYLKDSNEYPIFEVEIEKLDKYFVISQHIK